MFLDGGTARWGVGGWGSVQPEFLGVFYRGTEEFNEARGVPPWVVPAGSFGGRSAGVGFDLVGEARVVVVAGGFEGGQLILPTRASFDGSADEGSFGDDPVGGDLSLSRFVQVRV